MNDITMSQITAAEARAIATAMWGKINHTYKTNTKGAYCFSCEGHGGFIVATESIPNNQRDFVNKYSREYEAIRYTNTNTNKSRLMHHARIRGARFAYNKTENIKYYIFEEDCEYCIAVLAGINLKTTPIQIQDAKQTFWNWYDTNNPSVTHRKMVEQKRKNNDSDLIISAAGEWKTKNKDITEVTTADGKTHLVRNYNLARDEFGTPWLHLCTTA